MKHKKWYNREVNKGYDANDVTSTLEFFIKHQNKFENRDIYSWDAKDLENYIKENLESFTPNMIARRGSYEKLFEDESFLVVRPDDKESAAFWGKCTKWCITMLDSSYYQSYRDSNVVFYYIIDKKQDDKFAISIERTEKMNAKSILYFNAKDEQIEYKNLPKHIKKFLSSKQV